ncbi:MAG TPA: hypothetical protein VE870_05125, partial [Bacteroidales bacterium]|nr:hypothetical protein [Bacteroidales bacterium]
MKKTFTFLFTIALLLYSCSGQMNKKQAPGPVYPGNLYQFNDNLQPRWVSFENQTGEKGRGGMENNGAKGHPSDVIPAGKTVTLV